MRKTFTIFLLFWAFIFSASAQDLHFSQFYANPLHLNPALCGQFEGDFRITANYRNQYSSIIGSSPFRTFAFGYESRFFAFDDDYFAIGINVLKDQAGASRFATTQGNITANYIKFLSDWPTQYLSFGVQAGLVQRGINYNDLRFGTQFNGVDWDGSLSNQENFLNDNYMFWDVSTGLMYYMQFDENKRTNVYGGIALSHINRPNQAFIGGTSERLYQKITAHVGSTLQIGDNVDIIPGMLMHFMGPSKQIVPGFNARFIFDQSSDTYKAFQVGIWTRFNNSIESSFAYDALFPTLRFDFNQFSAGVSYDLNMSSLKTASSGRGGIEVSLMYTHDSGKKRQQGCPKF